MPHFIIEYSGNLEPDIDVAALCQTLRATAVAIDTFPMPGVRVRATRVDHYAIADGNPQHGFIDVSIRLRGGRPLDIKKAATEEIFDALTLFLMPVMQRRSIALSLEMRDIDPALSPKISTIRKHLEAGT
ncbi:MAG: 5-carboxymethyl-2-hydroxymuconate Delta-isomerase [Granulosicoccus sp.]